MKKFIVISGIFCSLLAFSGCEKELEDKYFNPDKTANVSISGFFTSMLNSDRIRPSYWNVRTFLLPQTAVYSQTSFFSNSTSVYQPSDNYLGQYWRDFYYPSGTGAGMIALYRSMEATYNKLSVEEKASQDVFMNAAKVVLYDQASQMVDLWGDIPFSEAGSLQSSSTIVNPKFDDQVALYNEFISGLESAATFFSTAQVNTNFNRADILLNGNLDKWERYANSLRLRLLMRASSSTESTLNETIAKEKILQILSDPAKYPLIDGTDGYNPANTDVLIRPLTNYTSNLWAALTELSSRNAPDAMLNDIMLPSNDPRIPVMFDKFGVTANNVFTPNTEYKAMPVDFPEETQAKEFSKYSTLDSATFLLNTSLPGIVMTAPEVNFLKAEAYERWGSRANAKSAYETAVSQSVAFYYYLNNLNTSGVKTVAKPDNATITEFVTNSSIAYTSDLTENLSLIATQKWLHFGFLQSIQAWAEYRRTGYPALSFPNEGKLAGYEQPPLRLLYPSNEKTNNAENYKAVQPKDLTTVKIFWDK
ncbi:SusD/RagB family nutrient-binding outer membrane lipoprotein [Cytophagaceae bacterium YF14B1]|uniref:SusD/RagB family nutrient-binding outer membrane lipoprotein n=1 Tax=Xanthocytophaga flava TaxID=3048013 RepID=A0AAE3U675_9BACT|nr:SusD/RagB family nutrient-binding outer membrane lipoprotein [Xanthocytophaga flavus]MDJ1481066.1 SusD/RagB family nutrient-binding outer membrane lipoprotein [Xanthocytophaga flavus]